jgi:hypothetical protein
MPEQLNHGCTEAEPMKQHDWEWHQGLRLLVVYLGVVAPEGHGPISPKDRKWINAKMERNKLVVELFKQGKTYTVCELVLHDLATIVDYSFSNGDLLVELSKSKSQLWPCLLHVPMNADEKNFLLDDDALAILHREGIKNETDETILTEEKRRLSRRDHYPAEAKQLKDTLRTVSEDITKLRLQRNPTMGGMLDMLRAALRMDRLGLGFIEEDEEEEFRDDEKTLSGEELLDKSKEFHFLFERREEEIHYLRLAAIYHYHPESTHEVYSRTNRFVKAEYFVLRLALHCNDMWANCTVADYIYEAVSPFPQYTALAVYFYQRAAESGCTEAMISLATIFMKEKVSALIGKPKDDQPLAVKWIQAAECRGSPSAYLYRVRLYLAGTFGHEKSHEHVKMYMRLLKKANRELLPYELEATILKMPDTSAIVNEQDTCCGVRS